MNGISSTVAFWLGLLIGSITASFGAFLGMRAAFKRSNEKFQKHFEELAGRTLTPQEVERLRRDKSKDLTPPEREYRGHVPPRPLPSPAPRKE
jgi:hypothetical protein